LEFANLRHFQGTVGELIDTMFDPTITFDDLKWIREQWKGNLVVKGIQSLEDAKSVADYGVEGIVLSNHGGRQLDRAPVPFHLLPEVSKHMKGEYEIMVDTGIMNGADIAAAVALGANSTMIGRAYLYGLMAGGQEGVERTLEILRDQLVRTMKLLGVNSVQELEPKHVQQLKRYEAIKFD
jgi:L-lactate dehydrogenase (cytochrome)